MLKIITVTTKYFFYPQQSWTNIHLGDKRAILVQAKELTTCSCNGKKVFPKYIMLGLNPVLLCEDFEKGTSFILVAHGIHMPMCLSNLFSLSVKLWKPDKMYSVGSSLTLHVGHNINW